MLEPMLAGGVVFLQALLPAVGLLAGGYVDD